ncbi:hypothetical protein AB6A40_001887 [Gnathostoma spinigerum]|uniref:Tyrosine aminotransferase n=1 Tax=Gnathostoma spinigerum TaxID=75299 RepID=A0ABD6EEA0_9BILA
MFVEMFATKLDIKTHDALKDVQNIGYSGYTDDSEKVDFENNGTIPTKQEHQPQYPSKRLAWETVHVSTYAAKTNNPIRKLVDVLSVQPNPNKTLIKLHIGDPTVSGVLPPCPATNAALHFATKSHKYDGYEPSMGSAEARNSVAQHFTHPEAVISSDNVILASGCSHALQMAIEAIADRGDNILVPSPGFPLYSTLMKPHGIEDRHYRLDMNQGGLIDLSHLESLIDSRTRAIIINNPSNPIGSVFPKWHLEAILRVAYHHRVPIIADEIYGCLTYSGEQFIPIATLTPKVPIITCDGIGKRYLVPGWRLGWVIVHDRYNVLSEVRNGILSLSQKIVGPCALVQGALPRILSHTPPEFFENIRKVLATNADIVWRNLNRSDLGLKVLRPSGAMYAMVHIDADLFGDEQLFCQSLITEESVFCLPGSVFNAPQWFRIVLTYSADVTREACDRIISYCRRHLDRS